MKFRVERDVLADAVTWTARTLPLRPATPTLAGVRIEARDGALHLSSFDYEVSARSEVPADITEDGTVLVSGRLLADIAKTLPNQPVSFELDGARVIVKCGASKFTLLTMPVDDYPALPPMPPAAGLVGDDFADAIAQVTIAASRDDTLPLLTAVRVEVEGDKITMLATDRYRLALRELTWQPLDSTTTATMLVRAKTLSDVAKTMAGGVTLALDHGIIGFEAGGRHTTSLLVDGDYPQVRRLFPDDTPILAVVNTADLIGAVKRVSLVAERNTPIRLAFTSGQVELSAGQGDDAQADEALKSDHTGDDVTVAFNPQFLLDGLTSVNAPEVRFGFTHPNKPVVFEGHSDAGVIGSFRYLLVPIRFGS